MLPSGPLGWHARFTEMKSLSSAAISKAILLCIQRLINAGMEINIEALNCSGTKCEDWIMSSMIYIFQKSFELDLVDAMMLELYRGLLLEE